MFCEYLATKFTSPDEEYLELFSALLDICKHPGSKAQLIFYLHLLVSISTGMHGLAGGRKGQISRYISEFKDFEYMCRLNAQAHPSTSNLQTPRYARHRSRFACSFQDSILSGTTSSHPSFPPPSQAHRDSTPQSLRPHHLYLSCTVSALHADAQG